MTRAFFIALTICTCHLIVAAQTIVPVASKAETSIRGLSVVDDKVAWVSGSKGWFGKTTDGGKTWQWNQPAGYDTLDFRDIEAFSDKKAIAVNAGSPAVILLTTDGGTSWKEVYRNNAPEIFLDGMDFWNDQTGIIYGDPIGGKMQLLKTTDGGSTWTNISETLGISLTEGEASFAASGTNIRTLSDGKCWIATGGRRSRIFYSQDFASSWTAYDCPIVQGESSTGPFSIAFLNSTTGVAVGGDYLKDTVRTRNVVLTKDGGKTWFPAESNPYGYRSSVEYLNNNFLVATGTSGTDISLNGGGRWHRISLTGFHVVRKAKKGDLVLLAGSQGRIAILKK